MHSIDSRCFLVGVLTLTCFGGTASLAADRSAPAGTQIEKSSVRVLVAYHSQSGNTERMAREVTAGARQAQGVRVTLKQVSQVTEEDLIAADGIILGAPTYYANIPGAMKAIIDDWAWKMKVDFTDKVGGAFATGGGKTGGKEHVVISLLLYMVNNRMLVAGPLYQGAQSDDIWAELGATAATGPVDPGLSAAELDGARRLGLRIASLAVRLKQSSH